MKTRKLIFMVSLVIIAIAKGYGQTNSVNGIFTSTPNGVNTSLGYLANAFPVSGGVTPIYNTFIGGLAGRYHTQGEGNTFVGYVCGGSYTTGSFNTGLGIGALENYGLPGTYNYNIGIGYYAGAQVQGNYNTFIGRACGAGLTTGGHNTFLGNSITIPSTASNTISTGFDTSNTVIFADGGGNQRFLIHSNGNTGIGLGNNQIPQNRLEIKSTSGISGLVPGTAGLRFRDFTNTNFSALTTGSAPKVLSVNGSGDVILVDDQLGTGGTSSGITNACGKLGFVTRNDAIGNLVCSQIYDNWNGSLFNLGASSVGIGLFNAPSSGFFQFNTAGLGTTTTGYTTGTLKLRVVGPVLGNVFISTSDVNYKKNINSLVNPLQAVLGLKGYSYNWDVANNPEMNFDDGDHTGFIAQDVETVLPHVVYNQELLNDKEEKITRKSINYIEIIPYLVEAIKEQNNQITTLRDQVDCLMEEIECGFEKQNKQLLQFSNTKIISISPNPSKDTIAISINVEKGIDKASLQVFDLAGKLLSSLNVNDRGNDISKTFQKDNFGAGVYIVSLMINGKSIDSKKFIFE